MVSGIVTFWQNFWIGVVAVVVVVGVVLGLTFGGYIFQTKVAAPLSKNIQEQQANNNYAVNNQSQQYQQTYLTEIQQGMVSITQESAEMARDKASGDTSDYGITDVEAAAEAGELCGYGQHLTQTTVDNMGPSTVTWFQMNCNDGVVAPTSEFYIPSA